VASVDEVAGGTLGEINVALLAVNISLPALAAQLDAMIGLGLGPLKFDLAAQLNATIAAQVSINASIGDPLAAIRLALQAVAQLQAALSVALVLPPIQLSLSAELSAVVAFAATLQIKLGLIEGLIRAAIAVKLPAINLSEGIGAALGVGPAILLAFDGITDGGTSMAAIGDLIRTKLQGPVTFSGDTIQPTDFVGGVLILTSVSPVLSALATLFAGMV
jgi:hypothetical protein